MKYFVFVISLYLFNLSVCTAKEANTDSLFDLSLEELMNLSVVIAASGFEQNTRKAPAAVSVITHEEWNAIGARLLSDVLATVPGFHVGKPQGDFMHKKLFIRGLSGVSSTQIKLLIDGEPFEWMQSNSLPVGFQMPLNNFERVEVVKGPGSVIYGADAFAGIVNLVSFKKNRMPAKFRSRVGSFNTYDFSLSNEFKFGDSNFQLSLDYSRSNDDDKRIINSDLQSVFDGIFGTSASKAPGPIDEHYEVLSLLGKWEWQNASIDYFSWRNFDMGNGAGPAQVLDPEGKGSSYAEHLNFEYNLSELLDMNLKLAFSYKKQKTKLRINVFPAGAVLPIGSDGNIDFVNPTVVTLFEDGVIGEPSPQGHSKTLRLNYTSSFSEYHKIRWEVGFEGQKFSPREAKNFGPGVLNGTELQVTGSLTDVSGTQYSYVPYATRYFYYMSFLDEWQMTPSTLLTLGVRYDRYSDFGSTTNPRVGVIWETSPSLVFKFFAGTAFRAPSFFQLYGANNPVNLGNPFLQPETMNSIETGLSMEYSLSRNLLMSANLYKYQAKDLIDFSFEEQQQGNIAQNIGEKNGKGGEIWLKWKPKSNVTIDLSYSFLSIENKESIDVEDIPQDMIYANVNWKITDDWRWNINAKWVANRKRGVSDARDDIPNYTLFNMKLERKELAKDLSVAMIVNNLLNADAREPSNGNIPDDYPLPGRQLLVEFSYQF